MRDAAGHLSQRAQEKVAGYAHTGGIQPPAGEAHVDLNTPTAQRMAEFTYKKHFPDGIPASGEEIPVPVGSTLQLGAFTKLRIDAVAHNPRSRLGELGEPQARAAFGAARGDRVDRVDRL